MIKSTIALLLVLSSLTLCLVSCGTEGSEPSSRETLSADSSVEESVLSSEAENSAEESSSEDSSEEEFVSKDPKEPIMKIPEYLDCDPIDAYFDDSVFIGYSIMMHFGRYTEHFRYLYGNSIMGTAEFRAGVGMNFRSNKNQDPSSPDTSLPKHNNVAYHFEDLPSAMGVKTMVIGLMPYSDMGIGSAANCTRMGADLEIEGLKLIREKNPDLHIIVLSGTYNTGESPGGAIKLDRVNNKNIRTFNNYVLEYCNEAGIDFIDVSTPLTNGYGVFIKEWSSDGSYHIKEDPYMIWVQLLRDYARKKENGTWKNPSVMPKLGFEIN
ncbi:MAG: hypothetical protein IJC49_04000 [Clostridia bacterium]|nr:hypothetical protein [Clostridia bacterium]